MNIEIIPAMDLIDGACVRLAQGDYDRRTTYGRDPLDTALRVEAAGLRSVIVGKALYEGRITLEDLGRCLPNE